MIATLASEDLACVAAGLLVHRGAIGPVPAIAACALGIFAGDLVLWSAGRLGGRSAVVRRLLGRAFEPTAVDQAARWLEGRAGRAILASRFLPGTRLPLYVAAGFLGVAAPVFAAWVLLAVLLWVPPVVLLAAGLGETFSGPFSTVVGSAGSTGLAVVGVVLALRAARVAATGAGGPHGWCGGGLVS
jgi:membrane protein DedA with SNARE-associated domain